MHIESETYQKHTCQYCGAVYTYESSDITTAMLVNKSLIFGRTYRRVTFVTYPICHGRHIVSDTKVPEDEYRTLQTLENLINNNDPRYVH